MPEEAVRHAFDLKPGDRGQLTCTLAGLERGADGRPTAKLRLKESDFRSGKAMLRRYGMPPIRGFEAQPDQSVKIVLRNGNVLTVLRKEDGGYRADTVWTR